MSGVVYLGEVVTRLPTLEVACNRCDRPRAVADGSPTGGAWAWHADTALLRIIAADCPRMIEGRTHDVCGVHFPDLSRRASA
jgi:hypothetical protein